MLVVTASEYIQSTAGFSGIVTYLALYIGLVLFIACAAILALQQLSEASDNARAYQVLAELGAEKGLASRALFCSDWCVLPVPTAYGSCARYLCDVHYGFCH